mgnify:CR=1 FL=1
MAVPLRFRRRLWVKSGTTISRLILECLDEFGEVALSSFFPRKYPEARIWRKLLGLDPEHQFRRESFSSLLTRMQREGLVSRSGSKQRSFWRLTVSGERHLREQERHSLPGVDGVCRVVVFDVPEKERAKRNALRLELIAAGFRQLQRSVWYGERPLPGDFIELIDAMNLRRHVHIFSVRDRGTLEPPRGGRSFIRTYT